MLVMVIKKNRANQYALYCKHGFLYPSVPGDELEYVPAAEKPEELDWNIEDLKGEMMMGTFARVTLEQVVQLQSRRTAVVLEPNSSQAMKLKRLETKAD